MASLSNHTHPAHTNPFMVSLSNHPFVVSLSNHTHPAHTNPFMVSLSNHPFVVSLSNHGRELARIHACSHRAFATTQAHPAPSGMSRCRFVVSACNAQPLR